MTNKHKMMTVAELKLQIQFLPDDMEVILQKDGEGNDYSPCAGADSESIYVPETTWCGKAYHLSWNSEDAGMTSTEWRQLKKDNKRSLILYPVN